MPQPTINKTLSLFPKKVWAALLITAVALVVFAKFIDLTPQVDNNFFFSSDDPHFKEDEKISDLFTRRDTQVIISATGDISSADYQQRIQHLSGLLQTYDAVSSVISITHGPDNAQDAVKSPLWKRLLISENQESTNIIILLDDTASRRLIPKIESLAEALEAPGFQLKISGLPYIVELIRRYLLRDIRVFSTLAFVLFGAVIFLTFHSRRILAGILIASTNAWILTLIITNIFGIKIGLLTANLITIIIVLTLSHIVFLTFNWRTIQREDPNNPSNTRKAIKMTLPASFWSMVTTLLGFLSLLFVAAQPLRELGISGSIGTGAAILAAYLIYPLFLETVHPKGSATPAQDYYQHIFSFFEKHTNAILLVLGGGTLVALLSIGLLNTDPSLISYFSKNSDIYQGLNYIDRNGGSSPLMIALKTNSGEKLISDKAYQQLWTLQNSLENHEAVGTIISFPILLSEGRRSPLTFFLTRNILLDILEQPQYGKIATSFITKDRQHALFFLRMREFNRTVPRLKIIDELKEIIQAYDFNPHLIGGVYALQGHLSRMVAISLVWGVGQLITLFGIIACFLSRSWRISLSMVLSISIVPLCILGGLGLLGIPLDVISSPAANVAIAIGIDAMIHMIKAYNRLSGIEDKQQRWHRVRKQLWEPVLTSMMIICLGFGIFFFSSFPPTQRFGGAIVLGSIIASIAALFVFPILSELRWQECLAKLQSWPKDLRLELPRLLRKKS